MSQISQIRKCYNCGAVLQSTDPSKEGYVNKDVLENGSQSFLFCNKCFEIERYRPKTNEPIINDDLVKIVEDAKNKHPPCMIITCFKTSKEKSILFWN